jgi:ribosomal protein S18 acetylase RimI-like enzyme
MLQIERAHASDIEPIHHLLLSQFAEHSISVPHTSLEQAIGELLKDARKGVCLVAREGGEIVGVAVISLAWTLEHGGKSAWLDELYVLPECRGRGVGQALLEQAITAAREMGCAALDLEVDQDHTRAERLYVRAGFQSLARSRWVKYLKEWSREERKLV